jgi:hypothetical protein
MVSFDGPAGDFGSLSAFLGSRTATAVNAVSRTVSRTVSNANGPGNEHTKTAQGVSGAKIDKDNTLLNKKVAFRMLKQLGCQVRRESEVSFVEVSLAKQPVLFKMLG